MTIDNRPQSSIYFEANTSAEASTGNCSKTIAARRHAKSPQGRGSAAQPRSWTGPCRRVSTGDQQHSGTFLIVLTFWLVILFIGFGLFAPSNLSVGRALRLCVFRFGRNLYGYRNGRSLYWGYANLQQTSSQRSNRNWRVIGNKGIHADEALTCCWREGRAPSRNGSRALTVVPAFPPC